MLTPDVIVICLCAILLVWAESPDTALVKTKLGNIRGTVTRIAGGPVTTKFLGIPFASPPVGDLRFRQPRRHPGWVNHVYNATKTGPACPQDIHGGKQIGQGRFSEDCLFLNIFIPRNLSFIEHERITRLSLPVMIWIHDGGFKNGYALSSDFSQLAHHGDVIIVSMNYRLGVFGFLSTDNATAPGNYGLFDQSLAIHWVWDNIREFGGNPMGITLFGQSSGGISVGYHVISPASRGTFIRAISHGGTMLSPCCLQRNPADLPIELAKILSCPTVSYEQMIHCLRRMPMVSVLRASKTVTRATGKSWLPVLDGIFIPDEPYKCMQNGKFSNVEYMIGTNSLDGIYYARRVVPDLLSGISEVKFENTVARYLRQYYGANFDRVVALTKLEYNFCFQTQSQYTQTLTNFIHDAEFLAPIERTARLHSRSGLTTFLYQYAHYSEKGEDISTYHVVSPPMDGNHVQGGESVALDMRTQSRRRDRRLNVFLQTAWTSFAKNGFPNPTGDTRIKWEPYRDGKRYYFQFSQSLTQDSLKKDLKPRHMAFWNEYLPRLKEAPPACSGRHDACRSISMSAKSREQQDQVLIWALAGLVVMMLLVNVGLLAWILKPRVLKCYEDWKKQKSLAKDEHETRKLRQIPIPYCEEQT